MNYAVRRLAPEDDGVAARVAAEFKSATVSPSHAAQFLANPANYLFVAESASELAGFVLAYRLDRLDRAASQLFVYEVGVLPKHQRRGVGTLLMSEVRRLVRDERLMEAFVLTESNNVAARQLYSGTGAEVESAHSVLFVYDSPWERS